MAIKAKEKSLYVLDALDSSILYYWDLDARKSAAAIAKKIGAKKETVHYRMRRLEEEGVILSTMAETQASKLGYHNIKTYFQFQHFTKDIENEFIAYLKSIPKVGWIVSCSGRWDALFCYWATSVYEFHAVLADIQNKFSKYILNKEVIHNIEWTYYNRKWLSTKHTPKAIVYGGEPSKTDLDKTDIAILEALTKDGRTAITDIATQTKESSQTIINRKRRLEEENVITKYSLNLNYEKLGIIFCKVFLYLQDVSEKQRKQLIAYCASQPRVFALTTSLGAWDMELEFEATSYEEVRTIMDELRMRHPDIVKTYESVIINDQVTPRYAWQ